MNIYIMADMEGISGVFSSEQVSLSGERYNEARKYMTDDINVCVEACKAAGADKVYVRDAHAGGENVIWDMLTPSAEAYIMGNTGQDRFPCLGACDGVILLGYHAMAGTPGAILEHSMSSRSVQNYWINGQKAGETAIDAGIVGDRGKPVIMVSGDDKLCCEAIKLLPWASAAEVKKGATWKGGVLLPRHRAHAVIREKTIEAISGLASAKPLIFDKPINFRAEYIERAMLPAQYAKPYMKIIDGRTVEVEASSVEEALFRL